MHCVLRLKVSSLRGSLHPEVHPQPESYCGNVNPTGLRACYDEGKRCAETLFFDYYRQLKIKIKVIRIFNTYRPKMQPDDGRVISNFIVHSLKNKDITIYGDGSQTRSFCYVDNLVEGIIKMMNSRENFVGPVNLGNPNELTILDLAKKIIKLTNSKSKIIYKPLPEDDPKQRQPNIELANKELKWSPKIELDKGLKKTISYFERLLKNEKLFFIVFSIKCTCIIYNI